MSSQAAPDPIYTLRGVQSPVTYLIFHEDGNSEDLYSGTQDGKVHVWDMELRRVKVTLEAHTGNSVIWIDFTKDGRMVTFGRDGFVVMWVKKDKNWTANDKISTGAIGFCPGSLITNHEDQELMILPSQQTSIVDIYNSSSLSKVGQLKPDAQKFGFAMCITACVSEQLILIGYENGNIASWDISNFKILNSIKVFEESIMCIDYSENVNKGICGSVNEKIISWRVQDRQITLGSSVEVKNPGFNQIRIRSDQKIFGTSGWDGYVRIFGMKKLQPLAVLKYHKDSVQCLTFSKDNILACGSKDQHISLWKIY